MIGEGKVINQKVLNSTELFASETCIWKFMQVNFSFL